MTEAPGARSTASSGARSTTPLLTRIDHVGIACRDLDASIDFYVATFGLTVAGRETNEAQGVHEAMLHVADAPGGASYVQLLEPLSPDTPVGKFLATRGEGVHHIGYGVADVAAALDLGRIRGVAAGRNSTVTKSAPAGRPLAANEI